MRLMFDGLFVAGIGMVIAIVRQTLAGALCAAFGIVIMTLMARLRRPFYEGVFFLGMSMTSFGVFYVGLEAIHEFVFASLLFGIVAVFEYFESRGADQSRP